jgi:predicted PurR-regulated permease PerM
MRKHAQILLAILIGWLLLGAIGAIIAVPVTWIVQDHVKREKKNTSA